MKKEQNQYNILFESELKALKELDKELAHKALNILDKSLEYKKINDDKILELERQNLELEKSDVKSFNFWYGFGMISFFVIVILSMILGAWLLMKGYESGAFFSFIIAILMLIPRIMQFSKTKR